MDAWRVRELCDDAWQFGWDYTFAVGRPPRLKDYASRYGKAFRKAGTTLRGGLASDERFKVNMDATGRYEVDLGVHPIERRLMGILSSGPKDWTGIAAELKGTGFKAGDVMAVLESMAKEGLAVRDGSVWGLVGVD